MTGLVWHSTLLPVLSLVILSLGTLVNYSPPQNYTAIVPFEPIPLYPIERCPNGTGNVFQREYSFKFGVSYTSLGCCSLGQYGVPNPSMPALLGCCPLGLFACLDDSLGTLTGCVSDPAVCTGNGQICSPGYGHCPAQLFSLNNTLSNNGDCCPLFNTSNPANLTAYCEVFTSPNITISNFGDPVYGSCSQPALAAAFPCLSGTVYTIANGTNITVPESSGIYCNSQPDCVLVFGSNYTIQNITFDNSTYTSAQAVDFQTVGCCASGLQPCLTNEQQLTGCANATRNETCCGSSICPLGSQCCFGNSTAGIQPLGCCPNALSCCTQTPYVDPLFANVTNFFCGATYNNQTCFVDMLANVAFPGN